MLNAEIVPDRYPVGPVEDVIVASHSGDGDRPRGYRVVSSRRELPIDALPIIKRIHRAPDGYVTFMGRTDAKGMRILGSACASGLDKKFRELEPKLDDDAYYSINGFYRGGTLKQRHLQFLNALYVDIDFHDASTSAQRPERLDEVTARAEASKPWRKALSAAWEAQEALLIPPPSLLSLSGRGVWLFYLLVDPETGLPPRAFDEKVVLYGAINRELHRRLEDYSEFLRPDPNAADASRITRVPGSRNATVNRRVKYLVQADQMGRGLVYGLSEIAALMGLDPKTGERPANKTERRVPARQAGWRARWKILLADVQELERIRGGFGEGCRNHALWVTAYAMGKLGRHDEAIEAEVQRRAAACRPPLSGEDALSAIGTAIEATRAKGAHIRSAVVRKWLRVTRAEESLMKTLIPDETRKARKAPQRGSLMVERRAVLTRIAGEDLRVRGALRSVRDYEFALRVAGIEASKTTVDRDLKALGFRSAPPSDEASRS